MEDTAISSDDMWSTPQLQCVNQINNDIMEKTFSKIGLVLQGLVSVLSIYLFGRHAWICAFNRGDVFLTIMMTVLMLLGLFMLRCTIKELKND